MAFTPLSFILAGWRKRGRDGVEGVLGGAGRREFKNSYSICFGSQKYRGKTTLLKYPTNSNVPYFEQCTLELIKSVDKEWLKQDSTL